MSFNNCPLEKDENGYLINPNGVCYAYARVSTKEQNLDRQLDALQEYGINPNHLFAENAPGKTSTELLIKDSYTYYVKETS